MLFKDYFSTQSSIYSKYRPSYPRELFEYLASISPSKNIAWDCATGSGQAAIGLAEFFESVIATDASEQQLKNAKLHPKVKYKLSKAEETDFPAEYFDLITVAQALHWLDISKFFKEVKRVLKPGGIIAVSLYSLVESDDEINEIIDDFYNNIVDSYWPAERKFVDRLYENIPFPFKEIKAPKFLMKTFWNCEHLFGYLESWSAVQRYKEQNGSNPIDLIREKIYKIWGNPEEQKELKWPLVLKVGVKN